MSCSTGNNARLLQLERRYLRLMTKVSERGPDADRREGVMNTLIAAMVAEDERLMARSETCARVHRTPAMGIWRTGCHVRLTRYSRSAELERLRRRRQPRTVPRC